MKPDDFETKKIQQMIARKNGGGLPDSLEGYRILKSLSSSERHFASHQIELWEDRTGKKVVTKTVAPGLEHTLSADVIGQRVFELFNLPCPHSKIIEDQEKPTLVMEYLEGYHDTPDILHLPSEHHDNPVIQRGIILDLWLHHYDRQPYNFMFKDQDVAFIDFGGSLTSSPSGKVTGFPETIDEAMIYRLVKAFQGPYAVNEAYAKVIDIDSRIKRIIVKDALLLKTLADELQKIFSDPVIDQVVEENILFIQRKNPVRIQKIIQEMQDNLALSKEAFLKKFQKDEKYFPSYQQNFSEALETFQIINDRFDSDESSYLKHALKKRRDSLVEFIQALV